MSAREVPEAGDTLGPYRLESALGEGGMGLVFRARRIDDGAEVALKLLKTELAGDYVFQHRFRQEARAAAEGRHDHPGAVPHPHHTRRFFPYIAVEYLSGGSLADRIDADGALTPDEAVRVVGEIAQGLEALHAAGIVHRDVKPANVLFTAEGTAKLTDFGLAKGRAYTVLTRPGQVLGTLDYLAPELVRGEPASPQTDLYALGCVAYECVTGRTPFADRSFFEIGLAHLEDAPADPREMKPETPEAVCSAILAALAKDPADRPDGAAAFAAMLCGPQEATL